ncbi:MAG TPA: TIGR00730 family Rossman fold protein [Steroidobacteraceae bacterium]|nr:TIGR00730 family Rossman fold protein [Steroidobacteraceae bacterium]
MGLHRLGVCVFCGSSTGTHPQYIEIARQLGALLAREDFEVIYGAGADGCMGALADGALAQGGQVIGVAPPFLGSVEHRHPRLTRFEPVADLATRKLRMLSLSAAAMVLPGGTGTLDEFLEVLTMKRLALVQHPLLVIDVAGFFRPLQSLLQHLIDTGFAGPEQMSLYQLVGDPADGVRALRAALAL